MKKIEHNKKRLAAGKADHLLTGMVSAKLMHFSFLYRQALSAFFFNSFMQSIALILKHLSGAAAYHLIRSFQPALSLPDLPPPALPPAARALEWPQGILKQTKSINT